MPVSVERVMRGAEEARAPTIGVRFGVWVLNEIDYLFPFPPMYPNRRYS
jgi:hypothetical protein